MPVYADDILVLTAVRDRLRLKVDGLSSSTCFICDTPVPDVLPPQVPICTICLGDENYDEATFNGAGPNALCALSAIFVTLISRCTLDPPPKAEDALIHTARGLLPLKRAVLSAVLLSDSQHCEGYADQWVPSTEGGDFLVERGFIPRGWSAPRYVDRGGHQYLGTSLTLSFSFDQELQF
jgi:hypothetical protein